MAPAKAWLAEQHISYEEIKEKENWSSGGRKATRVKKLRILHKIRDKEVHSVLGGGLEDEIGIELLTIIDVAGRQRIREIQLLAQRDGDLLPGRVGQRGMSISSWNVEETKEGFRVRYETLCHDIDPVVSDIESCWKRHELFLNQKMQMIWTQLF